MKTVSLKVPDALLKAGDRCARSLQVPRAEYIRRAVERMNRECEALVHGSRLAEASRKVRKESMRVNAEFAAFERDADVSERGDVRDELPGNAGLRRQKGSG
jgi:predicted transcriptional regulator